MFPYSWSAGQAVLTMGQGEQGDQHKDKYHLHLQIEGAQKNYLESNKMIPYCIFVASL